MSAARAHLQRPLPQHLIYRTHLRLFLLFEGVGPCPRGHQLCQAEGAADAEPSHSGKSLRCLPSISCACLRLRNSAMASDKTQLSMNAVA